MKTFIQEFKAFAMRGNVVDMAVGVIIGVAFGKIITALVDNILMPVIGMILGGRNFDSLSVTVGSATLAYGKFITAVIDFLIIALVLFFVIKLMSKFSKKEEPKPESKPEDVKLLEEIRDLLKKEKLP